MPATRDFAICERARSDATVLRTPYAVRPRFWIEKLIEIGYLDPARRGSAAAVEAADRRWREASQAFRDP
jgi:hypothetical protein